MGLADLGHRAAAREICGHAPVADAGDVGDQARADHEPGTPVEVERGCARIDHRADAEDDVGVGLLQLTRDLAEQVAGEVTAVGELDHGRAATGAGADDVEADLRIRMVEDRGHALGLQGGQDGEAVVAHGLISSAGRSGSPPCLSHPSPSGKAPVQVGVELCVSKPAPPIRSSVVSRRRDRKTRARRRGDRDASDDGGNEAGGSVCGTL